MKSLEETVDLMCSADYKERFIAEYMQTKIRYEKLKKFNNKIEAAGIISVDRATDKPAPEMPRHDSPLNVLKSQQNIMGNYLHELEIRAEFEGIDLPEV